MSKPMLTPSQLIEHLKSKGVKFEKTSEVDAKDFLDHRNYYLKLASYRTNYDKIPTGKRAGEYKNLDFAYLQDLSRIDAKVRYIVIQLCLDIEHSIKVLLLSDIVTRPGEDGYSIVNDFVLKHFYIMSKLMGHRGSEYCKGIIEKYYPDFPLWVFLELLSFSDLAKFCDYYNKRFSAIVVNTKLLNSVRDIRNASAHSSCLINNLRQGSIIPIGEIQQYVTSISTIGSISRQNKLSNKFIYDFVTLLYTYKSIIPDSATKTRSYEELCQLFDERLLENKDYYALNNIITSTYSFLKKVVDNIVTT